MSILGAIGLDLDTAPANLFDSATNVSIVTASGRSGGNALKGLSGSNSATKNLPSAQATLAIAMAINSALPATSAFLFEWLDAGTAQCSVKLNADGSVQAFRSTGTSLGVSAPGVVAPSVYQHIEAVATINSTTGAIQVFVNGVSVLNLTGQNTRSTTNNSASAVGWIIPLTNGLACDLVYGTAQIGDRRVECRMPTGAGSHTDWTPLSGANWQNVDEVPPNDDTDYNSSTTVGNIDSFAHQALSASPTTIDAVIVNVRAKNTTTGSGSVAPFLRSSTTDSPGTAVALGTNYQDFQTVYLTDPATGAAWANAAAVNAAEIGYKKTV